MLYCYHCSSCAELRNISVYLYMVKWWHQLQVEHCEKHNNSVIYYSRVAISSSLNSALSTVCIHTALAERHITSCTFYLRVLCKNMTSFLCWLSEYSRSRLLQACSCTLCCLEFRWRTGNSTTFFCLNWGLLCHTQAGPRFTKSLHCITVWSYQRPWFQ
jgi:hypothetical protein